MFLTAERRCRWVSVNLLPAVRCVSSMPSPRRRAKGTPKVFALLRAVAKASKAVAKASDDAATEDLAKEAQADLLSFLESHPEQAGATDDQLRTPLHLALTLGLELRVITALLEASPDIATAELKNDRNRLPIHLVRA